jgi:hypothetical protein
LADLALSLMISAGMSSGDWTAAQFPPWPANTPRAVKPSYERATPRRRDLRPTEGRHAREYSASDHDRRRRARRRRGNSVLGQKRRARRRYWTVASGELCLLPRSSELSKLRPRVGVHVRRADERARFPRSRLRARIIGCDSGRPRGGTSRCDAAPGTASTSQLRYRSREAEAGRPIKQHENCNIIFLAPAQLGAAIEDRFPKNPVESNE